MEISAKFVDTGRPGTGGFSKGRDFDVKIINLEKMEIDGETAFRSK